MGAQMELEEKLENNDKDKSKELEYEYFKLKGKLARLKGKSVARAENENANSFSVNQKSRDKGHLMNKAMSESGGTMGEMLGFFMGDITPNKNKGLVITDVEQKEKTLNLHNEEKGKQACMEGSHHDVEKNMVLEEKNQEGNQGMGMEMMMFDARPEKPKVKKYKLNPKNLYFIEMPEEFEEEAEERQGSEQNKINQDQGKELAIYMESTLHLKKEIEAAGADS
ncbi:hypothetical protein PIB30_062842 [Stylosanthes scabra]|uniref:Uncharacterized protein n=1 Tax=Stylosanthes scabra TaxID=79078 RepID=A0ABU6VKI9_9FABA|nr:hypothetical protein [Stylosanthes scabra]